MPDEAGRAATQRLMQMVRGLGPDDLVLCLVSGGGSALLSAPAAGLSLEDKQAVNRALLKSGAAIDEMNCVRKHLSAVKGGRLAALCAPARVVTLLISDVPGDAPGVIASGPTVPDQTTCADALAICRRYGIELPPAALAGLESGAFETPKPGDAAFAGHEVHLIATPQQSLEAAAELARSAGVAAHILSDEVEGESREVGKVHAALARAVARRGQPFAAPCVILSGGETTVTVRAKGGRRVPARLRDRAAGRGGGTCAGCRYRRHRRRRGQRRRAGQPRHAGARRGTGPEGAGLPRPQRLLQLLRGAGRPGGSGADLHQRQRLPRAVHRSALKGLGDRAQSPSSTSAATGSSRPTASPGDKVSRVSALETSTSPSPVVTVYSIVSPR